MCGSYVVYDRSGEEVGVSLDAFNQLLAAGYIHEDGMLKKEEDLEVKDHWHFLKCAVGQE